MQESQQLCPNQVYATHATHTQIFNCIWKYADLQHPLSPSSPPYHHYHHHHHHHHHQYYHLAGQELWDPSNPAMYVHRTLITGPRIHLANERTFLSWVRTCFPIGVAGSVLYQVSDIMTVVVVVVVVVVAMAISFYTNVPGLPPFLPSVFHSFLPSFLLFLPPVRGIFLGRVDAARVLPLFDLRAETVSYVLRSFPRPSFSPSFSSLFATQHLRPLFVNTTVIIATQQTNTKV